MMKKIISSLSIVAIVFGTIGYKPFIATAAQMTGVKDTISTVTVGATATHVISATLVGANTFATGDTIVYDFANADFTLNAIGNWTTSDFSFVDSTGSRSILAVSTVSGTPPTCTTSGQNVCVTIDTTNNTFTVFPTTTGFTASAAATATTFTIKGTTAVGTGTMTNGADVNSSQLSITETTDSATAAVVTETNATVSITATVAPTLTFANDDATVGFGQLTTANARYATGDTLGTATANTTAHTLTIGTNAPTGYTLTYNGPTLTHSNTIDTIAPATFTADSNGTPATSQFALDATVTGTGTVTSGYSRSVDDFKFVASTVSQVASSSGAVSSDTVAVRYLGNISASQAAGSYSTNLDWVVTGNF